MAEYSDIVWAVDDINARAREIGLYRDYYNGDHSTPWATEKWNKRFRELFEHFRDNLCPRIVDTQADKIQLTGLQGPQEEPDPESEEPTKSSPLDIAIERVWNRESLDRRSGEITKSSLKDGDCFVIIWPYEAKQARWYIQRGDRIAARYREEPQGELELVAKIWAVEAWEQPPHRTKWHWRMNLYYADRIERYITGKEWQDGELPRKIDEWEEHDPNPQEPGDSDEAPDAGGAVTPNPYGRVPVFCFPNNADTGAYGISVLKDVIPLQDALNKSVANMLVAEEFVAWPQRVLLGVEVDVDEEGNPTGREERVALERILAIGNPNAKVAEWSAADLTNFIKAQDSYRSEMARVSGTPLHYLLLSGEFPSGEAMDAAEAPLITLCDDRIKAFGPVYEEAMSFSLTIESVEHERSEINALFGPVKRQSSTQMAEEWRVKKELGVPDEQLWREMGYDESQIKAFTLAKQERTESMQAAFDAGTEGAVSPEGGAPVE